MKDPRFSISLRLALILRWRNTRARIAAGLAATWTGLRIAKNFLLTVPIIGPLIRLIL